MNSALPWFRLYTRMVDDEKVRLLAFEDRWHFVALCCLKGDGLLDEPNDDLRQRKIAVKLGVQIRELDEIGRRLQEVGLVDADLQPLAWDDLQFRSDSSTERVQKYRAKSKTSKTKRPRNVSVTVQETETDKDTEKKVTPLPPSVRGELEKVLDAPRAEAVIEARDKMRKPLTAYAAQLLAKQFAAWPDPNEAADAMVANGWQGFKPEYLANRSRAGPPKPTRTTADYFRTGQANDPTATPDLTPRRLPGPA